MKETKYAVMEHSDDYVICHGSGLSWADAHLLVISNILDDCGDKSLQNVKMYELEANTPGLGIYFELGDRKITYYILDDPGNVVAK